mgnify:CR=1 FL=1
MAKIKGAIVVDTERCKGCNLCVVACPLHVIALNAKQVNKKGYTFDPPGIRGYLQWLRIMCHSLSGRMHYCV